MFNVNKSDICILNIGIYRQAISKYINIYSDNKKDSLTNKTACVSC